MAASTYDQALSRLLVHEGGYSNHPSDPGGPTNFGITIYDYRQYVKPGATAADVKAMRLDEAKAIYRVKYWSALRCDELPAGLDYAIFDYGVNSGVGRGGKVLRRVLGLPDRTSAVTDEVIAAVKGIDPKRAIIAICDERLRFLKSLKTWPVFGVGWGSRVAEVKVAALAIAEGSTAAASITVNSRGKGLVPPSAAAQKGTAGGVTAAGATAAHQAAQNGYGIAAITSIIIASLLIGGFLWIALRWRQKHKQEAPAAA